MTQIHHITQGNTHLLLLVIVAFLLSIVSCKKEISETTSHDPNKLPPLTHEGKNTFGCLVNGEVWVAYRSFTVGGGVALDGYYDSQTGYLQLTASRRLDDQNKFESIKLLLDTLFTLGEYKMRINHLSTRGFTDYKDNFNCSKYYYDTTLVNGVVITYFSLAQGIVSGTFAMDLVNPSCPGDTIRIREGRFDWRMVIYN